MKTISGVSSEFFGHHNHAGFSIDNFRSGCGVYFPGEAYAPIVSNGERSLRFIVIRITGCYRKP
jgi:hypothetical protein